MELLYAVVMICVSVFLVFWFLAPLFSKPRAVKRKRGPSDDGWSVFSSSSLFNNDRDSQSGWGDVDGDMGSGDGDSGGGDGGSGGGGD